MKNKSKSKFLEQKRLLTEDEIIDIISCIKIQNDIPYSSAYSIMINNKNSLINQLNKEIYPQEIPNLKKIIEKYYNSSLVQPGESVGVICAQSVGERQTQMQLNSFATSGSLNLNLTQGVPRFQELLNATTNPKNVISKIYFKKNHSTIQELRNTIDSNLVELTFKSIAKEIIININKKKEVWYDSFELLYLNNEGIEFDKETYKDCITIKLNMDILYEYNLTPNKINKFMNDNWNDVICIFSPLQFAQLDIFVNTNNISLPENRLLYINENNINEIYLEECVQPLLEKTILAGIQDIKSVYFSLDKEKKDWYIEASGSNLQILLAQEYIDETRTISNNEWEIYHNFGIEATRKFLIEEFLVITDGINLAHIQLLVERMTSSGTISSITRYTMRKEDSGPFGKASFEESLDNFLKAANNGDVESTNGISASIICGKKSRVGTGMINVSVDVENLPGILEEEEEKKEENN